MEWRPVPGDDATRAAVLIQEELARLGVDARFEVQRMDPPFHPSPTEVLATLVESLSRSSSTTVAFGTEAAHLGSLTTETIVFGPGNMETAHKSGEYVPVHELSKCVDLLKTVIQTLCA